MSEQIQQNNQPIFLAHTLITLLITLIIVDAIGIPKKHPVQLMLNNLLQILQYQMLSLYPGKIKFFVYSNYQTYDIIITQIAKLQYMWLKEGR